jgi:hypothetical protein
MCVNKKQKYDGHIHLLYQDIIIGIHEVLTDFLFRILLLNIDISHEYFEVVELGGRMFFTSFIRIILNIAF